MVWLLKATLKTEISCEQDVSQMLICALTATDLGDAVARTTMSFERLSPGSPSFNNHPTITLIVPLI